MHSKIMILAAVLTAGIVTTALAGEEKPAGRAAVEQENARFNRSKTLSAQEIAAIAGGKSAAHARRAAEMAHPAPPAQAAASPFTGVIAAEDVPNPFRADELTILNFWGGRLNGNAIGVYAGVRPDDPSHGVLVVFDDKDNPRGTAYDVPGGPMSIASELHGILTLQARNARLRFDLITRRFE